SAIGPKQLAVVWTLILQSEPEGPALISCAARLHRVGCHSYMVASSLRRRGARSSAIPRHRILLPRRRSSPAAGSTNVSVTVLPGSILSPTARAIGVVNNSTVLNQGTVRTSRSQRLRDFEHWERQHAYQSRHRHHHWLARLRPRRTRLQ